MNIGDYVHNVPYGKRGVIVAELEPIRDLAGDLVEQRLEVLYDDGALTLTGSTFLKLVEDVV
jgi:hypothetical protein